MNFLYANARSIVKSGKFDELKGIIKSVSNKTHIIILTETWIKSDDDALILQLPNYTHYYNYRNDSRGGGVSLYIHNDLKHNQIDSIYTAGNNYLWVYIEQVALYVGAVYKPGHTNVTNFLADYELQIQNKNRAVVFGDFNLDLLETDSTVKKYQELLNENGFSIINKTDRQFCTRETSTTWSILDHVSTNLRRNHFHFAIIDSALSDHKQIYTAIEQERPIPKRKEEYKWVDYTGLYNSFDLSKLNNNDHEYQILQNFIKEIINTNTKMKIKILNLPQSDWINKTIINGINRRNQLWYQLKKDSNNEDLKARFKAERNKVTRDILSAKRNYYLDAFKKCCSKPKKTWKLINTLTANKLNYKCEPPKICTPQGNLTDGNLICEYFNNFFANVGTILANKIAPQYHDNLTSTIPTKFIKNVSLSKLDPTSPDEVEKIIDSLDTNTSSGIDGISTKVVKCLKKVIAGELSQCINKSLDDANFPDSLKMAKVSPIFKSGTKSDVNNYRPISVLPVMSKIYEKIIYDRLSKHLTSIDFLSVCQYGFRAKSNTISATTDLVTSIKSNIDSKNIVLGVFIDLKKAFDTVSHTLLLKKLHSIGVTGTAYGIFESYLANRSQIVQINEYQSEPLPIVCGVPQGSILGPLLFLIYINNIQEVPLHGDLTLYADDTCLFYYGKTIDEVTIKAQADLDILYDWFQYNLLTINASKTSYIIFKAKNKPIPDFTPLTINGEMLRLASEEKYLGLFLDGGLTWKTHIGNVKKKLSRLIGSLRSVVRCFPRQVAFMIYNSLAKPHLQYLIEMWGSAASKHIKELQCTQNKLIKKLFNYDYLTPTVKIFSDTKLMSVKQLYTLNVCLLIRKILHKDIHSQITFTKKKDIQNYRNRNAENLIIARSRTNYGRKNITHEGVQLYNKLPLEIRNLKSLTAFKNKCKQYVLSNVAIV